MKAGSVSASAQTGQPDEGFCPVDPLDQLGEYDLAFTASDIRNGWTSVKDIHRREAGVRSSDQDRDLVSSQLGGIALDQLERIAVDGHPDQSGAEAVPTSARLTAQAPAALSAR